MVLNHNDRQKRSCGPGTQCSSAISSSSATSSIPTSSSISSSSATSSILTSASVATPSPTSQNAITASTASAAPSETTTVVVDTPSPTPKGTIIAGVICGIIVLAIFTAMLWFFCRRRKQLNQSARSSPLVGSNGSEKSAMDHSIDEEAQRHSGGLFAPFGGNHESPFIEARDDAGRPMHGPLDIDTVEPKDTDVDSPIPDPEKSTLVAPPTHEHPAYHPLPGHTPNVPVYSLSQHSGHPASRSVSTSDPAYNPLPSQVPKRTKSNAPSIHAYDLLPSQSAPEPTYNPRSQRSHAPRRAEFQSPDLKPIESAVPEQSPELPALTFSPISLDTDTHSTPGTTYQFPSPSGNTPVPRFSSPIDRASSIAARSTTSSPSQVGRAIEEFRPTPLTAAEIAEIGSSMSPFRPTPSFESVPENSASTPPPATNQTEHTENSFQIPPIATATSENSRFTPDLEGSPTPPPLKCTKKSADRPTLSTVSTSYTPPKKPARTKDLPFNYISLPSPQSPSSPSAIHLPSSGIDTVARIGSTTTSYSIPIGLARSHKRQNTDDSAKEVIATNERVRLTHNHSREWSESDREHVMSWATYRGADSPLMEDAETFSPVIEQVAKGEKLERTKLVQPIQFQGGKLFGKTSSQEVVRSELAGRELKRKSPVQDLKESEKEGQKRPAKPELRRTSRKSFKEKIASLSNGISPKQESKRSSHKGERTSPNNEKVKASPWSDRREEVSPLFSPIQSGHQFSPLSPEERKLAGQAF